MFEEPNYDQAAFSASELSVSPGYSLNLEKDKHVHRSRLRSVFIVVTCASTMLVNVYNITSISISLATIGKAIHIQEEQLQWLMSSYSLCSGCILLFAGRLADLYGRKKAFMIGSVIQFAFSLGCGFAQNGPILIVLVGFQGIGAAATIPSALGILADTFPPSKARAIAFATFATGAPIGSACGMLIGGVLIQYTSPHWRSIFYLGAAISAASFFSALVSFPADKPSMETVKRVDWIGASLITIGLVLIIFVFSQGELAPQGWKTPYIIVLLVAGVFIVSLFLVWERYLEQVQDDPSRVSSIWTPPPLMRLSLWARAKGRMAVIFAIVFLNWSAFMGWNYWVQLYYQEYLLLSPEQAMVRFIPMYIVAIFCNFFVAVVIGKLPLVLFIVTGTLMTASACILFALIDPSASYWAFSFPSTIIIVFGSEFVYCCGTLFVAKIALPHEQSVGAAIFQTMTQLGTAFGLAISTIVFNSTVNKETAKLGIVVNSTGTSVLSQSARIEGYRYAQWTIASCALFAALIGAIFLRSVGIIGHKKIIECVDPDQAMKVMVDLKVLPDGHKDSEICI